MTAKPTVTLEVDDIQAPLLHPRPTHYAGAVILGRIDDRRDGRELLRRLIPFVPSASGPLDPDRKAWAAVALSFQGLKALGVPADTLASFPQEFQQGMAARAAELGDTGESAPENWEPPLGGPDVHVAIYALAPDPPSPEEVIAGARDALREIPGVAPVWLQDTYMLPTERTSLGFKDSISHPAIEGSGIPRNQPARGTVQSRRIRPGLPERERRAAPDAPARGARSQRHLRRLPQAPDPRGGIPPVHTCPRQEPRRRGAAGRQVRRPLAERRAAGARPGARRPGARGRSGAEQRLSLRRGRRRSGAQVPARRPRPSDEPTRLGHHRHSAQSPDNPA